MTEQEKLYGKTEKPQKTKVLNKVEQPKPLVIPESKPKYSLSQSTSAEDAKNMAV